MAVTARANKHRVTQGVKRWQWAFALNLAGGFGAGLLGFKSIHAAGLLTDSDVSLLAQVPVAVAFETDAAIAAWRAVAALGLHPHAWVRAAAARLLGAAFAHPRVGEPSLCLANVECRMLIYSAC